MSKYPKDWYKYLVRGDKVKIISVTREQNGERTKRIGKIATIVLSSKEYPIIHYGAGISASINLQDFIPIEMKAFPECSQEPSYEIY